MSTKEDRPKSVTLFVPDVALATIRGLQEEVPEADTVWSYLLTCIRSPLAEFPPELHPALTVLGVKLK